MFVTKRDGTLEAVNIHKIFNRIEMAVDREPKLNLDSRKIADEVVLGLEDNIKTSKLDDFTSIVCADKVGEHPDYGILAARIGISNLHKNTGRANALFSKTTKKLYNRTTNLGQKNPAVNKIYFQFVMDNSDKLDPMIHYDRDYRIDYFGLKTLERAYLLSNNDGTPLERPQDMYMRVTVALLMSNQEDVFSRIKETYNTLSRGLYSHASPTLFNAGTNFQQFASCYLLGIGDSRKEIMRAASKSADISSSSGGIGMHVSDIRSRGAIIRGIDGQSNGIINCLKLLKEVMNLFDQGGKRPGSMAVFMEPHHFDIFEFLNARKPHIDETMRAKELFYSLWISDLFMEQAEKNGDWYLMCPFDCPGLNNVYGDEYNKLYWKYVEEKKYKKKISAQSLWVEIVKTQIETGLPYIGFKDSINRKSNQKNIGTIRSSNLCMEIMEYSDLNQYAVCVLASIGIKNFILPYTENLYDTWEVYKEDTSHKKNIEILCIDDLMNKSFVINALHSEQTFKLTKFSKKIIDHAHLFEIVYLIVRNLNIIIDRNEYPNEESKRSNMLHRPLGIGIQGLADLYFILRLPFDSSDASNISKEIFETMYYAALWTSSELAIEQFKYNKQHGIKCDSNYKVGENIFPEGNTACCYVPKSEDDICPGYYSTFLLNGGCPYSKGILQYHLWGKDNSYNTSRWNWKALIKKIKIHGLRNSQLLALMPTASTSQILGNVECFEPLSANIYTRKTLAGEFIIINKYLFRDLLRMNLLTSDVLINMIKNDGSIKFLESDHPDLPEIKELYKTVWEIPMKSYIDQHIARSCYIDQSSSMNLYMKRPTVKNMISMLYYSWKGGLKTGSYYMRTRAAASAQKYIREPRDKKSQECTDDICTMCSA